MSFSKRQRQMLSKLCELTNKLGSPLDYTATSYLKLQAVQKSYMDTWKVLYGVLCDDPENDFREQDVKTAQEALDKIIELTKTVYPDRAGFM